MAAGWRHSLLLRDDGSVAAWGFNDCGQSRPPRVVAGGGCRAVALAGLCGLRTEPVILDDKKHEYEVHMGCDLYQARYLPGGLMWVVEAEGTAFAFTVDDRAGKVGPE